MFAQVVAAKSADWDLAKNKGGISCSVVGTEEGCSFNFTKIEMKMSAGDAASGQPSGKRQPKPFITTFAVSSSDNSVSEVKSPRDAASGLPTGKRQHKPMIITKELGKSSPVIANSVSSSEAATVQGSGKVNVQDISMTSTKGSGGGTGKVSMKDFHFTLNGNGKTLSFSCPDGSCEIPTDLPDGEYTLTCDWSWGMSQSGAKASPKRCSVDF